MAFAEELSNVQVLYQLSWEDKLEHPHMITVPYPSNQGGLRLKDVKKRLIALRGQGIARSFSWSFKRNYRNTFIWNDLSDEDVIYPLRGSGEYLLKASELIDTFANKPELESKFQHEKQISADRHSRTMSVDNLAVDNSKKNESGKQGVVAMNILQSLPPLSVEQETIDMEKSEYCLSSSDNEISPRPVEPNSSNPATNHGLVVMTKSPTVHGLQTSLPCTSPTEAPLSPSSAKRLWKKEIKKSLFRTRNTSASSPCRRHEIVCENATSQEEASVVQRSPEDPYLWKNSRSKSVNTLELKEKEVEQSTSQLIRLIWARWTGGSSKGKRILNNTSDESPCRAAKTLESTPNLLSRTESPCKEGEQFPTPEEILGELPLCPITPTAPSNPLPETSEVEKEIAVVETPTQESHQLEKLRTNQSALVVSELQIVLDTDTHKGGPSEVEIETPKPAIARAGCKSINTSKALPKVRTTATSQKPTPPGFHKGTNDTKPIRTPRRSSLSNSIPLASPPLRRSLSRDAARSLSAIGAITGSLEMDSVPSTPSPQKSIKKCINFHERDERTLTPGLTTSDWEKALQAAVADCLPPPNFGQILQECTTCGRTFKPDSLQVHRRGCHPPHYSRAFSARASPHMIRSPVL